MARRNRYPNSNDTNNQNQVEEAEGAVEMSEQIPEQVEESSDVLMKPKAVSETPAEIVPEQPKTEKKAAKKTMQVKISAAEMKKVNEEIENKTMDPVLKKIKSTIDAYGNAMQNSTRTEIINAFHRMLIEVLDAGREDGYQMLLDHLLSDRQLINPTVALSGINALPPIRRRITAGFYTIMYHLVKYKQDPKQNPFLLTIGGMKVTMSGTPYNFEKLFTFLHKHVPTLK